MAAKLAVATDNETAKKRTVQRKPAKIAATFEIISPDGLPIELMAGARLVVKSVTRDLEAFADQVLSNPAGVGLFAKIEVPFAEAEKA